VISDQVMTTRELAKYMKLNEKTVLKMAQTKEIPGIKIGSQWRFHLNAIDTYLQTNMSSGNTDDLSILLENAQQIIPLSRLMDRSLIELDLKSTTRNDTLLALATIARNAGITPSRKILSDQLIKREDMLSTALGKKVAIPHPRDPKPSLFSQPNIVLARSEKGIDFSAPDGKKTHLFIMICSPNMLIHLKLLAKISRVLQKENVIDSIMKASSRDEVMRLLLEIERKNIFPV
jgi:nitrogen PTS system EIIA component